MTSTRTPAGSPATIVAISSSAPRCPVRVLAAVLVGHAHHELQPVHPGRDGPLGACSLRTSAQRSTPARSVAAASSAASAIAGTRSGRTNEFSSRSRTPARRERLEDRHLVGRGHGRLGLEPVAQRHVAQADRAPEGRAASADIRRPPPRRRAARPARWRRGRAASASTWSVCSPRRGPAWRIEPGVAENRGTTPVMGTSQPWEDVMRCTISRRGSADRAACRAR